MCYLNMFLYLEKKPWKALLHTKIKCIYALWFHSIISVTTNSLFLITIFLVWELTVRRLQQPGSKWLLRQILQTLALLLRVALGHQIM